MHWCKLHILRFINPYCNKIIPVYSDWLTLRDQFNIIEDPGKMGKYLSQEYSNGEGPFLVPCIFKVSSDAINHLDAAILYSLVGELGYALWGASGGSVKLVGKGREPQGYPFSALFKRYFTSYFKHGSENNGAQINLVPRLNGLMIGLLYAPENQSYGNKNGYIGAGVVTDINIDSLRNFKYWSEGQGAHEEKYWILRFRMKMIWLASSLRNSINSNIPEIRKWLENGKPLNGVPKILMNVMGESINEVPPTRSNNCFEDKDYVEGVKNFLLSKIENNEIKNTLEFYHNFPSLFSGYTHIQSTHYGVSCKPVKDALKLAKERILNELYLAEPSLIDNLIDALKIGNVLIVGPPGVGKTEIATILAESICEDYEKATANALWTRRDLIGGETIRQGTVTWRPGLILRAYMKSSQICDNCLFPIIIEELNRADIDKAFGDFFTIFSSVFPDRWRINPSLVEEIRSFVNAGINQQELNQLLDVMENDLKSVQNPLSKIRIIGTMNLRDARNLYQIGDAITRRFAIFHLKCPEGDSDVKKAIEKVSTKYSVDIPESIKGSLAEVVHDLRTALDSKFCLSTATVYKVTYHITQMYKDDRTSISKEDIGNIINMYIGTIDDKVTRKITNIIKSPKK